MARPDSWRPWYAKNRAAYNWKRHRELTRLAARGGKFLSLYDSAVVARQQAALYRAKAEWWDELAAILEGERHRPPVA